MTNPETCHVSGEEFVALANLILARHGGKSYEDGVIAIRPKHDGLGLEIERLAKFRPDMSQTNPTTMVTKEGEIIRHHGEHCYLVPHMRLLAGLVVNQDAKAFRARLLARGDEALRSRGEKPPKTVDEMFHSHRFLQAVGAEFIDATAPAVRLEAAAPPAGYVGDEV